MAASGLVKPSGLMDAANCFAFVRQRRWPEGIRRPACDSDAAVCDGHDDTQPCRQRYRCRACSGHLDDLTGLDAAPRYLPLGDRCAMVLAEHHQPLRVVGAVPLLHGPEPFRFMGLSLSSRQTALEPGLDASDVQAMTEQLRRGLAAGAPAVELRGEVEPDARASSGIDEVHVAAGHEGQPAAVATRGGSGTVAGWQARRAAARWRRTSRPSSA